MSLRSTAAPLWGVAALALAFAVVLVGGTLIAGPGSELHDTASVARMPVPGTADVELTARGYGLYFSMLNAPMRRVMRAPKLSITIVPPQGIDDPEFAEVPAQADVYVDGTHTVQVARIAVRGSGRYHVHVESPEESGGSFSIGELPELLDKERALARLAPAILSLLGLAAVLAIIATMVRRRRAD